jgi:hypothetical protein
MNSKSHCRRKKPKPASSEPRLDYLSLLPVVVAMAIVPLIVRLKLVATPQDCLVWATRAVTQAPDLFAYYKGLVVVGTAALSLLIIGYRLYTKRWRTPVNVSHAALVGYLVLVALSFAFSINQRVSLIGYFEHYENVFVIASYIILFFFTATAIQEENEIKVVLTAWMGSIAIMFLIGLSQFFGHDFLFTDLGKALILPAKFATASFANDHDTGRNVYQTLYHYNYVSFYSAMGFAFFLVLGLLTKERKFKVGCLVVAAMMVFNQYASLSRNGIVGMLVSLVVVLIFLRKLIVGHWQLVVPVFCVVVLLLSGYLLRSESSLVRRLKHTLVSINQKADYPLNAIDSSPEAITIDHDRYKLILRYEPTNQLATPFSFYDEAGILRAYSMDKKTRTCHVDGIPKAALSFKYGLLNKRPAIKLIINHSKWVFVHNQDGLAYLNPAQERDQIVSAASVGFAGRERFGSARGYIWSRALPLLKQRPWLGSGPETFPFAFPQNDFVAKYNAYNNQAMIVDKPHNIYLGYALSTGVPSLIALLVVWMSYLVWSIRLYLKADFTCLYSQVGLASMVALVAYLAAGFFNDTNLNVTPTFWLILGLGVAANTQYQTRSIRKKTPDEAR